MAMETVPFDGATSKTITRRSLLRTMAVGSAAGLGSALWPQCASAVTDVAGDRATDTQVPPVRRDAPTAYDAPLVVPWDDYMVDTKRVLVVIDYQVDFVDGGVFGRIVPAVAVEEALYERVLEYQRQGDVVIYTMDTHPADGYSRTREGAVNPQHCDPESPGWAVYGRVGKLLTPDQAIEVRKGTYGSLQLPVLIQGLMAQGVRVESIELAGVSTTCRVLHNAIILFNAFPELPFIMDARTTAAYDDAATKEQLEELESWGFVVRW